MEKKKVKNGTAVLINVIAFVIFALTVIAGLLAISYNNPSLGISLIGIGIAFTVFAFGLSEVIHLLTNIEAHLDK